MHFAQLQFRQNGRTRAQLGQQVVVLSRVAQRCRQRNGARQVVAGQHIVLDVGQLAIHHFEAGANAVLQSRQFLGAQIVGSREHGFASLVARLHRLRAGQKVVDAVDGAAKAAASRTARPTAAAAGRLLDQLAGRANLCALESTRSEGVPC